MERKKENSSPFGSIIDFAIALIPIFAYSLHYFHQSAYLNVFRVPTVFINYGIQEVLQNLLNLATITLIPMIGAILANWLFFRLIKNNGTVLVKAVQDLHIHLL